MTDIYLYTFCLYLLFALNKLYINKKYLILVAAFSIQRTCSALILHVSSYSSFRMTCTV